MRSPEFSDNLRWFNGRPLKMRALRGKAAVLVDFWTYSCVNCLRTLPHIKEWHERYKNRGLVIVGVHTPEFEFEKNVENVARAVKEFGIEYPVVMDSDYEVWSLYSNNAWPSKFLINKDGQIVYTRVGEGGYRETEEAIQKALLELNSELKLPLIAASEAGSGTVCLPRTPELYLGSMRSSTWLTAGGHTGKFWDHRGAWKVFPEYIEHERGSTPSAGSGRGSLTTGGSTLLTTGKTEGFEDYILLNFDASEVNLVMEFSSERATKIRLELDGKFLKDIEVREAKMYNLVSPKDIAHEHGKTSRGQLKIYVRDAGFRAYAFTFGGCA